MEKLELELARRVVEAARLWRDGEDLEPDQIEGELLDALRVYDQHVGYRRPV